MIIGIDPGLSGAVCLIDGQTALRVHSMPTAWEGKKRHVDGFFLARLFQNFDRICGDQRPTVFLEKVSAMPQQGVTSVFNFGRSYGAAEALVASMGWKLIRVPPSQWKRRAGLLKSTKRASIDRAIELFPEVRGRLRRQKDDGRAEALLIAYFGSSRTSAPS